MPSLTHSRLFNFRLLAVLVAFAGLASGCQSSRPSFSFQPIRLRAAGPVARAAVTQSGPSEASAAAVAVAPTVPLAASIAGQKRAQPVTKASAEAPAPAETQAKPTQAQLLATATAQTTASTQNRALAPLRRHLLHRAHAPARQGLGLTVLGLLGMVALVVALIGLAISGGGTGWIITAAIAAGVVLLAYLDPGGH